MKSSKKLICFIIYYFGTKGNYIATCKSPINSIWYHYNENYVFPVKNFNLEVLTNSIPWVLFYKRRQ